MTASPITNPATDATTDPASGSPSAAPTTRRRLPGPLRAESRRGIGPWAGGAVLVTALATMASKAATWQGSWGETQSLLHTAAALLCGPLAVAAGCWHGGRERRRGTEELRGSAARSRLAQTLMAVVPLVLWVLAGYAAAAAAVSVATWPYTSSGSPVPSLAAADVAWLATATTVGFVAGRLIPWRVTAPLLAACTYVVVGIPAYFSSDLRFLGPTEQTEIERYLPVWWQGPVMVTWFGGLGLAALLAYAVRRRLIALAPLAAATAAAVLIVQTGDGMWREDPAHARQVCGGSVPRICVSRFDSALLPEVTEALAGASSRLEGVEGAPVGYRHDGQKPKPGEVALPYLSRGWTVARDRLTDPDGYAREAVDHMLWRYCSVAAHDKDRRGFERVETTTQAVLDWLAPLDGAEHARGGRTPAATRLAEMGDPERREWLSRFFATRKSCTPKDVPTL
ncbi:MAG TPA: hypothetical protein VFH94_24670 [Streptomyces sp.]|nr:hypothetical protein [Streptomyces sp.]